jgi:hypothetical protein
MLNWMEQILGILLVILVCLDVFTTILYARIGTSVFSNLLAHLVWRLLRGLSSLFKHKQAVMLSFCGPLILVLLVTIWAILLTCGMALVFQPELGKSIVSSSGQTPTDFITAMYVGGSSVAIVGASDYTPQTGLFRMVFLFNSLLGISIISLTLTYLMQVYVALQRRNTLGLLVQTASGETGDAAELLTGLGPEGQFSGGYNNLSEMSGQMISVKESHHFYPLLFYFRFQESYYSVSHFTLVALDTVTLIKSGLNDHEYRWLKNSTAVNQLWQAAMDLLTKLDANFEPRHFARQPPPADEQTQKRWRKRYFKALERLQQANIKTVEDAVAGAELYVKLRSQWCYYITILAPVLAYNLDEIDPAVGRIITTEPGLS